MKKIIALLAPLMLLYGCTLTMEENEILEEEPQGYDEPYTVDSDLGTVTYQYHEGVIQVSDRLQEYLVQVDHDSILYFMTSMPAESQPYVGALLASGCTRKLPMGLNHRVISAEDVGGFLKVVCTKVTVDDIYEELDYCIDADMSFPNLSNFSDEELEAMGYQRHDSMIIDWGVHDSIMGINEEQLETRRQVMRRLTRGDKMDSVETGQDKLYKNEFINITLDSRNIQKLVAGLKQSNTYLLDYVEAIEAQLKSQQNQSSNSKIREILKHAYVGLNIQILHYQRAHAEKNKSKNYELEYTDTWTEGKIGVEAGFEYSKSPEPELTQDMIGKNTRSWSSGLTEYLVLVNEMGEHHVPKDLVPKDKTKKSWSTPPLRVIIPAGPVPLAFIAEASINPEVSISGSVAAAITYKSAVRRTGHETKHGKDNPIDKEISPSSVTLDNISLNGKIKVGANFRAAAGLEVAGTFACTVGANVDVFAEAEGKLEFSKEEDENGSSHIICTPTGSARFYIDFYGDVQLHVAPLGIKMWNKQVATFLTVHLIDLNTHLEPNIWSVNGYCINDEGKYAAYGYYSMGDVGGLRLLSNLNKYRPSMKVFFGPMKDNNWKWMTQDFDKDKAAYGKIESKKTYSFVQKGEVPEGVTELHFQPCFVAEDPESDTPKVIYGDEDKTANCELGIPDIYVYYSTQTCGEPLWDFTLFQDGTKNYVPSGNNGQNVSVVDPSKLDMRVYKFMSMMIVRNGSNMKSWGLKVKIQIKDQGKWVDFIRHKYPINKCVSGTYTMQFTFYTDWKQPEGVSEERLRYVVQPYWEDKKGEKFEQPSNESYIVNVLKYECNNISNLYEKGQDPYYGTILPGKEVEP